MKQKKYIHIHLKINLIEAVVAQEHKSVTVNTMVEFIYSISPRVKYIRSGAKEH